MQPSTLRKQSLTALISSALAVFMAGVPAAAGDPPQLVKDINTQPASSYPTGMTDVEGTTFFFACDGSHNLILFTVVGADVPVAVKTVGQCDPAASDTTYDPGDHPQVPDVAVGNRLFFIPDPFANIGEEVWVSDGTPSGTFPLNEDVSLRLIGQPTAVGDTFYFTAASSQGDGLWKSDGTPEGTVMVKQLFDTPSLIDLIFNRIFVASGDTLFFPRNGDLWKSDGTSLGTVRVKDIIPGGSSGTGDLTAAGGKVYFTAGPETADGYEHQLWVSDGSGAGTHRVKNIDPTHPDTVGTPVAVGSRVYFAASDGSHGQELWKSNGTSTGTKMVKDIRPGVRGSKPRSLLAVGSRLSFTATDGVHARTLFATDGTSAGTHALKKPVPVQQAAVGSELYFTTSTSDSLWKSDGTTAGTTPLPDVDPTGDASPGELTAVGTDLYFSANDGVHGRELWITDGSTPNTGIVADLNAATTGSEATVLASAGGNVLFSADDGGGRALWATDGSELGTTALTPDGTLLMDPIDPDGNWSSASVGSTFYFQGTDAAHGGELWKSNGTPLGTGMVKDILPGTDSSWPTDLTAAGGKLFFTAGPDNAIWTSDGTSTGTTTVRTFATGSVHELTRVGTEVYFVVLVPLNCLFCGDAHEHLWKTDGTLAGTVRVSSHDFLGYDLSDFTAVGHTLYFMASGELWKSNGTASGTYRVKALPVEVDGLSTAGGHLFIATSRYDSGLDTDVPQLWVSDGTASSTKLLHEFTLPRGPIEMTAMNGKLYFAADDRTDECCGHELWTSDGTVGGTVTVGSDLFGPATPSSFRSIDGVLYFAAQGSYGSSSGQELWSSDGSTSTLVADLDPNGSSQPAGFTKLGTNLVFSADDGVHGREMWELPLP